MPDMNDKDFDRALVSAALRLAGEQGWARMNVAAAARTAGLSLAEARLRCRNRQQVLCRLGEMLDEAALTGVASEGPVRDRLFDLLMRRFDALQAHRSGVLALLRALPCEPATALLLTCTTRQSMRWMLHAVDVSTAGLRGEVRVRGLMAIWFWCVRAWQRDESEDLSTTMAAVDSALNRAESAAGWLDVRGESAATMSEADPTDTPADSEPKAPDPIAPRDQQQPPDQAGEPPLV